VHLVASTLPRDLRPPFLILISRKGDSVWYLGTAFSDAEQTVPWYTKRSWIEERFGVVRIGLAAPRIY
jgi:hypothetical protein